jgi:hypothetical protein
VIFCIFLGNGSHYQPDTFGLFIGGFLYIHQGNQIQNKAITTIERRLGFSILFDVEMPYESLEEINIAIIEFLSLFM